MLDGVGCRIGSPGRARTADLVINSHPLYRLSYRGIRERRMVLTCRGMGQIESQLCELLAHAGQRFFEYVHAVGGGEAQAIGDAKRCTGHHRYLGVLK